jgi:hypothetical protein
MFKPVKTRFAFRFLTVVVSLSAASAAADTPCPSDWSPLAGQVGDGVGGESSGDEVRATAVFDDGSGPALYAAGRFLTAGGKVANSIAKWSGAEWEPLAGPNGVGLLNVNGNGLGRVEALAVFNDGSGAALYAAGRFDHAGGKFANNIARWTGQDWEPIVWNGENGVSDRVLALAVYDDGSGPALFVGGRFRYAGGIEADRIARWDGSGWTSLAGSQGEGLSWQVSSLIVHDQFGQSELYVGGRFEVAGGLVANGIARWNGSDWALFESDSYGVGVSWVYDVTSMAVYGGELHIGLYIISGNTQHVIRWGGEDWYALSGPDPELGVEGDVSALEPGLWQDQPVLFAGGSFYEAGGLDVRRIAMWDGQRWSALSGSGEPGTLSGGVYTIHAAPSGSDSAIYAGGSFSAMGDVAVNHIAAWGCVPDGCPADVSGDGQIDLADLNIVLAKFGQAAAVGDTNGDGVVDLVDLNAILAGFGSLCS